MGVTGPALGIAALAVGLVAALLAVPLHVVVCVRHVDRPGARLHIAWMFGLVRLRWAFAAASRRPRSVSGPSATAVPHPALATRAGRAGRAGPAVVARRLLGDAGLRRRARRFVGDVAAACRWRRLCVDLRLGLGDPSDTGRLWAIVGPVGGWLRQRHPRVRIEPDFSQPALNLRAHGRLRLVPLRVLLLGAGFALALLPATLGAWLAARSGAHA